MVPKLYENDQRVRTILQAIIDGDNKYVLDHKYIRWGAVQRDIEAIIREKAAEIERLRAIFTKIKTFKGNNPFVSPGDFDYILDLVDEALKGGE